MLSLKRGGIAAVLVAAASAVIAGIAPAVVQARAAAPPYTAAAQSPIKHVVVIDMENHTFDNVLGYWSVVTLADAPTGECPRR